MAPHFQTLEVLQEHGIAANDVQKLQAAGYHTVESVRSVHFNREKYKKEWQASLFFLSTFLSLTYSFTYSCIIYYFRLLIPLSANSPKSRVFPKPKS
jgi:hypothetical protein